MPNIPNIPKLESLNIHMDIQVSWAFSQCLRVEYPEYPEYAEFPEYAEYPEIGVPEYPYGYSNVLGPLPMSQS